ncbi:MAG: cytochrome C oxidase subunit IV family protein [Acidobacteriaceae bacterium]|nr:cytochrome C oxidase subunit IV family protein [Acidobacteriaceae bacterium]
MEHHIAPVRDYVGVWVALVILTFTTAGVAYIDMGPFNIVVAISIAVVKMALVVWIFMGVRYTTTLTRLFVVAGFFWFLILIVLTGQDYISRGWLPRGKMW